jgi:hypothetical protein
VRNKISNGYIPIIVSVFYLSHFLYYLIFSASRLSGWYFYPVVLAVVWIFPEIAGDIYRRIKDASMTSGFVGSNEISFSYILICFLFIFLIITAPWAMTSSDGFKTDNYELAKETNSDFPEHTVFAMGDRAGSFGYFSDHSVINIEGLVNNDEILPHLRNDTLGAYLSEQNVDYLIVHYDAPQNYSTTTISPTHRTQTVETNVTVYRQCEVETPTEHVVFDWECIKSDTE